MIIINSNGETYKTPSKKRSAAGYLAGDMARNVISVGAGLSMIPLMDKMFETAQVSDIKPLRKGITDAFEKSGLPKNGVTIIDAKRSRELEKQPKSVLKRIANYPKNIVKLVKELQTYKPQETNPELYQALQDSLPKWFKKINPIGSEIYVKLIQRMIEDGSNACFIPNANKVAVNIDELGVSTFHEMGHALNKNQSAFWNLAQKTRTPLSIAGALFATTALLKRKKVDGEQPKNNFDKVTTFIKDNVGKLVTLSFLPIVAEELMATHKGEKMAKEVLSEDLLKKVKTCNRIGASTYIIGGLSAGLAAYVGSKVRDAIAKPKQIS